MPSYPRLLDPICQASTGSFHQEKVLKFSRPINRLPPRPLLVLVLHLLVLLLLLLVAATTTTTTTPTTILITSFWRYNHFGHLLSHSRMGFVKVVAVFEFEHASVETMRYAPHNQQIIVQRVLVFIFWLSKLHIHALRKNHCIAQSESFCDKNACQLSKQWLIGRRKLVSLSNVLQAPVQIQVKSGYLTRDLCKHAVPRSLKVVRTGAKCWSNITFSVASPPHGSTASPCWRPHVFLHRSTALTRTNHSIYYLQ